MIILEQMEVLAASMQCIWANRWISAVGNGLQWGGSMVFIGYIYYETDFSI